MNKRTVLAVALALVACTSWAVMSVVADPGDGSQVVSSTVDGTPSTVLEVVGPPNSGDNPDVNDGPPTLLESVPATPAKAGGGDIGAPRALCGGSTTITLNNDPATIGGTVLCSNQMNPGTENSWARCFPASLFSAPNPPFNLTCIDLALSTDSAFVPADGPYDTELVISFIADCNEATVESIGFGAANIQRTITVSLPGDSSLDGTFLNIQVTPPLVIDGALNGGLLVEWHNIGGAGTSNMSPGANPAGSTCSPISGGCSYLWAPPCGITTYQDSQQIGGFTGALLYNLGGDPFNVPVACCTNSSGLCDDTGAILAGDCLGADHRFLLLGPPNNFTCADFNPPCGLGACCNNDGTPDGACVLNTLTACAPVGTFPPPPIGANFRWTGGVNCADVSCAPPPLNDDCRFAFPLTGAHVSTAFTTLGATTLLLPSDPLPCGDIFKDAWWTYTVPAIPGGVLVVSTVGSSYDSSFTVYADQVSPLTRCSDISNGLILEQDNGGDTTCRSNDISANNALSYMVYAPTIPFAGGEVLTIRVGGPGANDGGDGILNIDYIGIPGFDTRCCFADGTCSDLDTGTCDAMGGFWNTETDFFEGILPDPLMPETGEFLGLGCSTLPCPPLGNAPWSALDLLPMLPGPPVNDVRQQVALTTRQKLYLKWTLSPGETITIDTCGTAESVNGFDTIIEAFGDVGFSGAGDTNGAPTIPITTSITGGVNDTCGIPDDVQLCRTGTNSCMCVSFDDAVNAGVPLDPPNFTTVTVIFCIGTPNTGTDTTVNSVDPVLNPFDPPADVVVGAITRTACVVCEVVGDLPGEIFEVPDPITGVPAQVFPIDESTVVGNPELACADGLSNRFNDGCSVGGLLQTVAIAEPVHDAAPIYMYGSVGVYNDPNLSQRADQDWYSFTLTQTSRLTARLVSAEFLAQMVIFRAGALDPCNIGGLALTTTLDCVDVNFSVDACAGDYFLVIRSATPSKPPCGAEYLMGISSTAVPPGSHCTCPADLNNDDRVDGLDIELFVSTILNPPVALPDPVAQTLGGCFSQAACAADVDGDGSVTLADGPGFVAALLAGVPCPAVPPCQATNKCQIPTQQGQGPTGTLCIFDDVSRTLTGADNFIAEEDGMVSSACWWGTMNTTTAPCSNPLGDGTTTFNIRYYDDAGGLPGTLISEFLGVTPVATLTGEVLASGIGDLVEIEFTASHAPIAVAAGQCYWIEIQGDSSAACFFCWETAPAGDGLSVQSAGAPFVLGDENPYDLAFCVDVRIASNGCAGPATDPVGQCCYIGELGPLCVETTSIRCTVTYDGYNFDPAADCTVCCPAPSCEITCQAGDQLEPEGCGFNKNEGCNNGQAIPTFSTVMGNNGVLGQIACQSPALPPVSICGTIPGNVNDFNDDWFEFNVLQPGFLTLTFETSNDNSAFLVTIDPATCTVTTIASATSNGDCLPATAQTFFAGGLAYVVVQGSQANSPACGSPEASYRVSIGCASDAACVPALVCPPLSTVETEACGLDTNGGCNTTPPAPPAYEAMTLPCPGTVTLCGTAPTLGAAVGRDTDWWGPVTLAADTDVTVTLTSDFTAVAFAVEVTDCANVVISSGSAISGGCVPATFNECLTAGTWAFFVAPSNPDGSIRTEGSPCAAPTNPSYVMDITCGSPCVSGSTGVVCGAEPLGCQSPNLASGNLSDQDQGTSVIDDFVPIATGNVTSICWWGFQDDLLLPGPQDCTTATDSFEITYYADGVDNRPDTATIVGGPFAVTPTRTIEMATAGSTIYRYDLAVPHAPVPVTVGVCTWVEIKQTNGDCFCSWFWMNSDQASGNGRLVDNTAGVLTPFFNDAAFCVDVAVDPGVCPVLGACCIVPIDVPVCIATETEAACLARPEAPEWHRFEDCATFTCPVPPQDSCTAAGDITAFINGSSITGDNTTATPPQHDGNPAMRDPELPPGSPSCQWNGVPDDVHNTVWWKLVAPANGSLTVRTCDSPASNGANNRDTIIALYSTPDGTCTVLTEVNCAEDTCSAGGGGAAPDYFSSFSTSLLTPGATYYLMLANTGSWAGSNPGPFQVDITSP